MDKQLQSWKEYQKHFDSLSGKDKMKFEDDALSSILTKEEMERRTDSELLKEIEKLTLSFLKSPTKKNLKSVTDAMDDCDGSKLDGVEFNLEWRLLLLYAAEELAKQGKNKLSKQFAMHYKDTQVEDWEDWDTPHFDGKTHFPGQENK